MDIFKQFATDENSELNGVWVPAGDAEFLVARSGNREYGRELNRLVEQNRVLLDSKTDESDKTSESILVKVTAKTILLGWRGNVEYKGKKLDYSVENAEMLLAHKDFRRQVATWAEDLSLFRAKLEEEQLGN